MLIEWMSNLINNIGMGLMNILPLSPFTDFIESVQLPEWIGFLNWFFPVSAFLGVMAIWLTAVGLFYLYSTIMRWVKMIGS